MVETEAAAAGGTRCGFIALIGAPNAGKSTLTNALTGSKVAIVTPKVQTTRALVRGIALAGNAQLIFIDTPGIFAPKRRLDRAMVTTAWSGAHDADLVAVLIDAKSGFDDEAQAIFGKLDEVRQPKVLVLNKVDIADKPRLLDLAQTSNTRGKFAATFMVSALTGDGVTRPARLAGRQRAGGAVALSGGRGVGCAGASARGRDHPREALPQAASGIALPVDGGDRDLDGAQGRIGAHRADDLRGARKPAQDRAGQGGPLHPRDRRGVPQGAWPKSWRSRCIFFCS